MDSTLLAQFPLAEEAIAAWGVVVWPMVELEVTMPSARRRPVRLLEGTYWFPWYNNVELDTQLRFGIP